MKNGMNRSLCIISREYSLEKTSTPFYNVHNSITLTQKPDTGVFVKDLTSFIVKGAKDVKEVMYTGRNNRITAETNMNERSSRSHAIFTLTIETAEIGVDLKSHIRVGKLNLVDLAGSERLSKTGATGERLEEATKINLSLSTLCHVISTLTDPKGAAYVPYRNSKLTRLLQDSLGGNTKTAMVANIGPADYNYDETINTLRYANRAKNILNKPRINEDPKDAMIREFQEEITRLRIMIAEKLGHKLNAQGEIIGETVEDARAEKEMEDEIMKKTVELKEKEEEIKKVEAESVMAEAEKLKILDKLKKEQEEKEKAKREQQDLLKKTKQLQEKILMGSKEMEEVRKKELELKKARDEIAAAKDKEKKFAMALKKKEEEQLNLESKFSSLQEELDYKRKKLKSIYQKCKEAQSELDDRNEELRKQKDEMYNTLKECKMELELKQLIVESYIPEPELERIEERAQWSEETEDWLIPHLQFAGNNLRMVKPIVPGMHPNDAFPNEEGIPVEPMQTNYYYVYTEEGFARDEAAVARHKRKNRRQEIKKKSVTSSKRQEKAKPTKEASFPKAKGLVSSKVFTD